MNIEKKFDFFFSFSKILKVRNTGRKTLGFQTVWILKNFRTFGPDVIYGRALTITNFLVDL